MRKDFRSVDFFFVFEIERFVVEATGSACTCKHSISPVFFMSAFKPHPPRLAFHHVLTSSMQL